MLCVDLYCGLGGWAEGFLSEGYDVIGFDIEHRPYPGQLVLQDVLTLHGSQFRHAAIIVASPPCQGYSYRAMPWKRAKALPPPDNALFDACFRIQQEACEAAGRYIPLVVENVKGAQPWVGRAKWHYGSYYLWGDVPALMPEAKAVKVSGVDWHNYGKPRDSHGAKVTATKNNGGSWFAVAHNTDSGHSQNPVTGEGVKQHGSGPAWFDKALDERRRQATAIKNGKDWFGSGQNCSLQRHASSRSSARKHASALIAKIPFSLAQHLAGVFRVQ
jgi:hypothetical protein